MLTGRDAVADRVQALDAGADDYLVKPFSIEELLARLRALARRSPAGGGGQAASEVLQLEDLQLDLASHEVSRGGVAVQLSRTEFQLLQCLMAGAGRVQSRESLLERVWGESFVGDANVLDVYVRYLRRKLEPPGQPTLIQTVRGVGFLLKAGAIKEPAA
jgi:two-component system response regulator MprA